MKTLSAFNWIRAPQNNLIGTLLETKNMQSINTPHEKQQFLTPQFNKSPLDKTYAHPINMCLITKKYHVPHKSNHSPPLVKKKIYLPASPRFCRIGRPHPIRRATEGHWKVGFNRSERSWNSKLDGSEFPAMKINTLVGWGFQRFFIFTTPIPGENDSHFDEHIFQRGWNHQLDLGWLEVVKLGCLPGS